MSESPTTAPPEGVAPLDWDGDALRVESEDGTESVTLRFSFEAIAEYEGRYGSIYGALDDGRVSTLVGILSAFGGLSLKDAFDAYGKIGHNRSIVAVAFVISRLLEFGGLRTADGEAEADPKA